MFVDPGALYKLVQTQHLSLPAPASVAGQDAAQNTASKQHTRLLQPKVCSYTMSQGLRHTSLSFCTNRLRVSGSKLVYEYYITSLMGVLSISDRFRRQTAAGSGSSRQVRLICLSANTSKFHCLSQAH